MQQSDPKQQSQKRKTGWSKPAGKKARRGIYRRAKVKGFEWGFYDSQARRVIGGFTSQNDAVQAQAESTLRKGKGLPAPNRSRTVGDYIELLRERKRRELSSPTSRQLAERALDLMHEQLGHLKPGQVGPDRLERFEADFYAGKITGRALTHGAVTRYASIWSQVFKLAVRDGAIPVSPTTLMERRKAAPKKARFEWSPESISWILGASERLARHPEARYDYSPLIRLLALTGLRVSEALALRKGDVDLLGGRLHVRHSLRRDGTLGPPKTAAGRRVVPLGDALVELLARVIPADAVEDDFVFASKRSPKRPLSYFNFRSRGFEPALRAAGLADRGITVHDLRHAAVSLYAARGLTNVEVASIVGHGDPGVTAKVYSHLFDRSDVEARVRAAQSLERES